jgi:8-oxo-dGTP pyrophosphatase MutT (NUDIX family)
VEAGEQERQTAIREVFEETGIRIEIRSDFQGSSSYSPRPGVLKTVIFFLGDYLGGQLIPQLSEVRAAAWLPLEEADRLLVFDRDRQIFHQALEYRRQRAAS